MGFLLQLDGLIGATINLIMPVEMRTAATYGEDLVANGTTSYAEENIELCVKGLSGETNPNPKNRCLREDALTNMCGTPGFLLCAQDVK